MGILGVAGHQWSHQSKGVSLTSYLRDKLYSETLKILIDYFQRYSWSKNTVVWLDKNISTYNLWTKILPDM